MFIIIPPTLHKMSVLLVSQLKLEDTNKSVLKNKN